MSASEETHSAELFEAVWDKAVAGIEKITQDEADRKFLKSVAMGGSVAAEATVAACQEISKYWDGGNETVATELSQLFSLMMLSQIYRWIREKPPEGMTNTVPPEVSATRIIYIFDGEPERGMEDFLHFNSQYAYDLDHHTHLIHFASLLLARVSEICGHQALDWSKVKWPVVEMTHLTRGTIIDGTAMRSKLDIDNLLSSLSTGVQAMMSFYGQLS